ncbi:unnamed protein product [Dracunculus medinensis]|uniref:CHCH domain-containing protein n=1 Tax=Dracunculus medinensis TaxID=318479 RepID=A0A3P7PLB9_DRAME|nr:unnamed protein product [Dracunculus medinensis]
MLFQCLRKWEFDDLHCKSQHKAYFDCTASAALTLQQFKMAARDGTLGESKMHESGASVAQINRLMTLFPQPGLGKRPYRKMKRLPDQSYADDIFHRQNKEGKRS